MSFDYTFRLLFSGLCAFVLNTDLNKGGRVLLVDARNSTPYSYDGTTYPRILHIPCVRYKLSDLKTKTIANKELDLIHPGSTYPNNLQGMWALDKDDLTIRINGLLVTGAITLGDFNNTSSMKEIYHEDRNKGLRVRPDCLTNTIENAPNVVGRIKLNAGTIRIYNPTGADLTNDPYAAKNNAGNRVPYKSSEQYNFLNMKENANTKPADTHKSYLYSCIAFDLPVPKKSDKEAGEVTIESQSPNGASSITFAPPASASDIVSVMIENGPPLGIPMSDQPVQNDIDYTYVYDVADPNSNINYFDPAKPRIPRFPGAFPFPVVCVVAVYNDDGNA